MIQANQEAHRAAGHWGVPTMVFQGEPFFGATYIPPRAGVRGVRRGLVEVLGDLSRRYRDERGSLVERARVISERVAREVRGTARHRSAPAGPR